MQFNYRSVVTGPDYFQVDLSAAEGPLSTRDCRIVLEAVDIGIGPLSCNSHELDPQEYLQMKKNEYQRQQVAQ